MRTTCVRSAPFDIETDEQRHILYDGEGKSKRKEMLGQRGAEWASGSVENDDG